MGGASACNGDHCNRTTRLYERHREELVGVALAQLPGTDRATAEDVVQDAVVTVLDRPVQLPQDDEAAVRRLATVVKNEARNRRRFDEVRETEGLDAVGRGLEGGAETSWLAYRDCRLRRDVAEAFDRLTTAQREVATLRYLQDHRIKEIAGLRGCAVSTVNELLRQARADLAESLVEWE